MTRNTDPTPRTRQTVLDRDGHACILCAAVTGLQVHHRRARGMGGSRRPDTNQPQNLVTICALHHAQVESHRTWALRHGLLVRQHADPATVPITTWRGVVRLDAAGNINPIEGANR